MMKWWWHSKSWSHPFSKRMGQKPCKQGHGRHLSFFLFQFYFFFTSVFKTDVTRTLSVIIIISSFHFQQPSSNLIGQHIQEDGLHQIWLVNIFRKMGCNISEVGLYSSYIGQFKKVVILPICASTGVVHWSKKPCSCCQIRFLADVTYTLECPPI